MPIFRIQAKQLFFTWPQNDYSPEDAVTVLKERFQDFGITWIECVQEEHKDGSLHLHALVLCEEKVRKSGNHLLEMNGKHGHFKPARNPRGLHEDYFQKNPVQYASFGVWPFQDKKRKISDEVAEALLNGVPLKELASLHPGFVMSHLQKMLLFQALVCQSGERVPVKMNLTMDPCSAKLARWLGMNLHTKRPIRAPQLYVHSSPGVGKTTTFAMLGQEINIFRPVRPNGSSVYWDGYSDEETDLILFDEWNCQWPITAMNDLLSGAPTTLKIHGGTIKKNINKPIVLLSNLHITKNYPNVPHQVYDAFIDRLQGLTISEPLRLFKLQI